MTVWSIVTKILIKEIRRLMLTGEMDKLHTVEGDIDVMIYELTRTGSYMQLA